MTRYRKYIIIFICLMLFHLSVSSLFYYISIKGYFPSLHNGKGVWNYACDSNKYHKKALLWLDLLKRGKWRQWWTQRYRDWGHLKWIALMYWLFKPVPLAMAPFNALTWSVCVLLIFYITSLLLADSKKAVVVAILFSFFPSYLMNSIQLLKDPFYVLGVLLFLQAWVFAWTLTSKKRGNLWKMFLSILGLILGFRMINDMRPFFLWMFLSFSFLFGIASYIFKGKNWKIYTVLIVVSVMFLVLKLPSSENRQLKLKKCRNIYQWHYSDWLPRGIEHQLIRLSRMRWRFCTLAPFAGSNIDTGVHFHGVADIVKYMPRAMEIGFLAPFPNFWFKPARKAGKISRLIVGAEMIFIYLTYLGLFFHFYIKKISLEKALLLMWGSSFIILLALVVANLGTIHRMRHIYLLPFFIYGIGGWYSILEWRES